MFYFIPFGEMIFVCFVTLTVLSINYTNGNSKNTPDYWEISLGSILQITKRDVGRIPNTKHLNSESSNLGGPKTSILANSSGSVPSKLANSSGSITSKLVSSSGSIPSKLANSSASITSKLVSSSGSIPSKMANSSASVPSKLINSSGTIPSKLANTGEPIPLGISNNFNDSDTSSSGFQGASNMQSSESDLDIPKQKTCCSALPAICNEDGQCTLDMATCVKLCLCVIGIRDSWCQDILNSLARESTDTPATIHHTELSPHIVGPSSNSTESVDIDVSALVVEPRSNSSKITDTNLPHLGTKPPSDSTGPVDTDLSPFVKEPPSNSIEPLNSHSMTTASHLNAGAMLGNDSIHTPTTGRHSRKSSQHIVGVPLSNNMSKLSAGEIDFQTQVNATNLTEQYHLPKQTHSDPGKAELSDLIMKQTTSHTTSALLTFDQNTNDSSAHQGIGTLFRKASSFGTTSVESPGLPISKDLSSNTNDLSIPFSFGMPNDISLPSLSPDDDDDVSTHPCENCSGICRLVFFPSYELICEETEVDKCQNFHCGDHGTCVVSNVTGLVSCSCDDMYTGTFCENFCDLDCGDDGKCSFINNSAICVCNWNNTGEFCELLKTTTTPETIVLAVRAHPVPWHLIGVCLALLLVLFVVCVVLPYWSWRRRWLPMRKLVHYFQSYEEDDGKLYDAFVSYKASKQDEDFVVHKLFPKLEKELEFKLCLHFRDFPPGETIADNIIHAIENSRRTILILSPNFVQSEWCRLEYQKAQQEMLKLKHKIIPIMLQDISKMADVDKNLKQIMNTVTFIEWPGDEETKRVDKFWQLMQCSMPKKNPDSSGSEKSLGSCSSQKPLTSRTESCCLDTLSDDVFSSSESTSSNWSDEQKIDSPKVSDSNLCDEYVEKTTLFIENETDTSSSKTNKNVIKNETNKTNCNIMDNSKQNETTFSKKSNSFSRSITIVSDKSQVCNCKSDANLIQIQRLPGNKLKIRKMSSANSESHS